MKALILAVLLAGAPPASATAASPPTAEGVDYLAGRWLVSSKDPETGETELVDYLVERVPGGAWLAGRAASHDGRLNSRDIWGHDPLTGEIIRVVFDGSGAFATVRSAGWQGEGLVLEGEVRSQRGTLPVRETITRSGHDRFDATWEAKRGGAWVTYAIESVTRVN